MNQGEIIILADPLEDAEGDAREVEERAFVIDARHHGERLDRTLATLVPEFSRSYLQQLIAAGAVIVAGVAVTRPSLKVKAGDRGSVELRPTPWSKTRIAPRSRSGGR